MSTKFSNEFTKEEKERRTEGKSHKVESHYYTTPAWCSICHDFIWGTKVMTFKK